MYIDESVMGREITGSDASRGTAFVVDCAYFWVTALRRVGITAIETFPFSGPTAPSGQRSGGGKYDRHVHFAVTPEGQMVWDASSVQMTLFVMLLVTLVFLPIGFSYKGTVFQILRERVTASWRKNNSSSL